MVRVSRCAQVFLTFQADLAGVLEHCLAVDLEGLAELDGGASDDFLQFGLALEQRELPQVATIEVEEIGRP
jgi:hypothetical protein